MCCSHSTLPWLLRNWDYVSETATKVERLGTLDGSVGISVLGTAKEFYFTGHWWCTWREESGDWKGL